MNKLTDQLRAVVSQHVTHVEPQWYVAHQCGMTASTLSRFLAGKGGISLEAADRLAVYLGLTLVRVGAGPFPKP